ncbi:MAG: TonB family protein [Gammaproteobacteria bacterium]
MVLPALVIACLLTACTSPGVQPNATAHAYWQDPAWINTLAKDINAKLVYPFDKFHADFPSGHALVAFSYDRGRLDQVQIIQSTGNAILDASIAKQISGMQPPPAAGDDLDMAHRFELPVSLSMMQSPFFLAMHAALMRQVYYPLLAVHNDEQGMVVIHFQYRNGKILNPTVIKSIGARIFEAAALDQIRRAKMPPPPPWAHDRTFSLRVPYCYNLRGYVCPAMRFVVRYAGTNATPVPAPPLCAQVGFDYHDGVIADVHLLKSSGKSTADQEALTTIARGAFPQPSAAARTRTSGFTVPVCVDAVAPGLAGSTGPV